MTSSLLRWAATSIVMAGVGLLSCGLALSANAQPSNGASGATAREAMTSIFDRKDPSAVDRFFADPFLQHDPNIPDGLAGLRQYAAEIAASPRAKIKIYRTLEDGDLVLLHSKYEGLNVHGTSLVAFDLFRVKDGKIVEHWGGQEPEAPPNPSARTQVDGPTEVVDREKTETNRTLVRTYRRYRRQGARHLPRKGYPALYPARRRLRPTRSPRRRLHCARGAPLQGRETSGQNDVDA